MALLQQEHELVEEPSHTLGIRALDVDLVAPDPDLGPAERVLDEAKQLVALAEKPDHEVVAGDEDLDRGRGHGRFAKGYCHRLVGLAWGAHPGGHPMRRPPMT